MWNMAGMKWEREKGASSFIILFYLSVDFTHTQRLRPQLDIIPLISNQLYTTSKNCIIFRKTFCSAIKHHLMSVIYLSYDMTMMNLDWILRVRFYAVCCSKLCCVECCMAWHITLLIPPFFLAGIAPPIAFTHFTRYGVYI